MFEGFAILAADDSALRAQIDIDFFRYYRQLFYAATYQTLIVSSGRYGLHITVANKIFHSFDAALLAQYHGRRISFFYNPEEIYEGGRNQWLLSGGLGPPRFHTGFYMKIVSPDLEKIDKELGINQDFHLSLFKNKHAVKNNSDFSCKRIKMV